MRRKKEEIEEVEEIEEEEEVDTKEERKKKREEKKEKRLKRKKQDKAARWAGVIMLFIIMIVGFLMWVTGEMRSGNEGYAEPVGNSQIRPVQSPASKVIVR